MRREFVHRGGPVTDLVKLERIMLVEDEPDIRAVCELALETDEAFEVRSFADAESAYVQFQSFAPQVLLLDVMMPGEDGPSMMKRLRDTGELGEARVIFLTAKAQPDEVRRHLEMGAIGVIEKPFDPLTLSAKIRRLWSQDHG